MCEVMCEVAGISPAGPCGSGSLVATGTGLGMRFWSEAHPVLPPLLRRWPATCGWAGGFRAG
jgi:hypothetical protein